MTLIPKAELLERLRALKYPPNYGGKEQRTANYYLDKAIAIVEGMGEESVKRAENPVGETGHSSPATDEPSVIPDTALLEVLVEKVADAVSHDLAVYGVQNDDAPWDVAVRAVNFMRSYLATQ